MTVKFHDLNPIRSGDTEGIGHPKMARKISGPSARNGAPGDHLRTVPTN